MAARAGAFIATKKHRPFVPIGRILKINGLGALAGDVLHAARATLVIGSAWVEPAVRKSGIVQRTDRSRAGRHSCRGAQPFAA